ncbi:TetR/AcrR family transcriptional regulator [Pseudonocardia asaccharolytica]|uniref:Transcriptional regulator n=1 Tax=Pseudonocardia asaccharolytica DSM 44247 = NBRC 16224 TaxID=1123024 RepID=A0A511CYW0_9PSEU|nr:TetR/AcrR family transcriptional regulator [Pseudonocardia asaccharolytica]GEL17731.1 transcriptional regulator [Pseudonocardia asaccharolytica DSM 44247 = NBRC 16224]
MTAAPDAVPEPPWRTPRKAVPARRQLSREVIVEVALQVLRAEGIDAVSMRRVATELGTGAASLYAHIANKDELLELVFDEVVGEVPVPEPDPRRWQEQVTQLWKDSHAALARHGDIARVALGTVPLGPNALRVSEATMALLRLGGVPDQTVAWAVDVVGLFVAANAVEGAVHVDRQRAGRDPRAYFEQVGRYLSELPADRFPTMAALAPLMLQGSGEERFVFGLNLLVEGLVAQADRARTTR